MATKEASERKPARAAAASQRASAETTLSEIGSASSVLLLPALRSTMGTWIYYTAAMRLGDVAARVRLAQDIHTSSSLNELIQRALDRRAGDISEYLVTQKKERFFNAIVIGVYGGDPEWLDLRVES